MIATSSRYVPPVLLDRFENLILRSRQPSRENKRRILAMRSPFYESNPFRFVARTLFLKYVYIYISVDIRSFLLSGRNSKQEIVKDFGSRASMDAHDRIDLHSGVFSRF